MRRRLHQRYGRRLTPPTDAACHTHRTRDGTRARRGEQQGGTMKRKALFVAAAALTLAVPATQQVSHAGGNPNRTTTIVYDSFAKPGGYTMADYLTKWNNGFGPGEMAINDTRTFNNDAFHIAAAPFQTSVDLSVFDHIKYIATSNQGFAVPAHGSVTFSAEISAVTPGTQPGRVVHGCYGPSFSFPTTASPCAQPYSATVLRRSASGRDTAHARLRDRPALRLVRLGLDRLHPHRAFAGERARLSGSWHTRHDVHADHRGIPDQPRAAHGRDHLHPRARTAPTSSSSSTESASPRSARSASPSTSRTVTTPGSTRRWAQARS